VKPLLLLGGGGHCHAAIDVIEAEAQYRIVGVVLPLSDDSGPVLGYPIVGSDDDLAALLAETQRALITVGHIKSPATRMRLFDWIKNHGAELPVVRSPRAYCSRRATIGKGSILMHDSLINANAEIGVNCIVNSQALIEHDVEVGDHCHISTGARVNGGVRVGTGCFIGSGAVLKEGIEIGNGTIIGAGEVVLRDVEPGRTVSIIRD
jgi:sugar O-acyltransferase (sialic acid O-acetyltransferase NeuD family)